ncbi:hypothetical protein [Nannocystis punicea]|uniref:Uncharacterized protein n=1 Tax=Nannocystis punicea TaxID=2995304 RepID=A0ABY7H4W9_9BACT|nr:hypothetical protein [Nannocystis poenicansa]WAS94316.1 hypothetical protein O0S08_49980 [Nannocystis poenicansa]
MRPASRLMWLLAAALGVAAGCLIELDPQADCGDGFIDALAQEDCEPSLPDSYADRCAELGQVAGPAACDPKSCRFTPSGCSSCGNGVLDPGEECDPEDMTAPTCPGEGVATCRDNCTVDRSACSACGNGMVDLDEECDFALDLDDLALEVPCTDLDSPAGITRRYGSGSSTKCTSKCEWDRSQCSYCQNDKLEGDEVVDGLYVDFEQTIQPAPEVCDNQQADPEALVIHCQGACGSNYRVECKFKCADDCQAFDKTANLPTEELGCCTARGEACPYDPQTGDLMPGRNDCCRKLTHPEENPCEPVNFPILINVCR